MKKAAAIVIGCVVLQIAQCAVLTLAVFSVAMFILVSRFLIAAGKRGLL